MTRAVVIRRCPLCPEKRIVATRVAETLRAEDGLDVEMRWGGLGELTVWLDGERIIKTNRFWFTSGEEIVRRVRAALDASA